MQSSSNRVAENQYLQAILPRHYQHLCILIALYNVVVTAAAAAAATIIKLSLLLSLSKEGHVFTCICLLVY